MKILISDEIDCDSQEILIQIDEIKKKNQERISSNKRKAQVRLTHHSQNFGLYWFLIRFFLLLIISLILQFVYFAILYPRSRRITNLLKTYILGVETWSSLVTIACSMMQTIIWNNTSPFWGTDPLSVFQTHMDYTEANVMNNITEALNYDLGNSTESYRNLMTVVG